VAIEIAPERSERPTRQSPWRLLAAAFGWWLLGFACSFVCGVVIGFVAAIYPTQVVAWTVLNFYVVGIAFDAVLLVAALVQGRSVGAGNIHVGLANEPVSGLPIVVLMAAALASYAVFVNFVIEAPRTDLISKTPPVSPWLVMLYVFRAVCVAPVVEELWFRGWLWTGLRESWGLLPTALLTSVLWIAMHIGLPITTLAVLLPVAAVLAFARHLGQSVRAPIALHAIYNLAAISPWILKQFGLH
jgi:membrane protease YdiL (CAAX protease family)